MTLGNNMGDNFKRLGEAAIPIPTIDWAYIRSSEQAIAALHLRAGSLRTNVLELFDVANNIGKDEYLTGSTALHVTQQKRKEVAAEIHSIEVDENQNLEAVQKLETELREHWATYAAYQCRIFCDCVRQKLPRELRDMVCQALWADAHHTITDWNLRALSIAPENPVALVESWSGRDTSFCFEERFVGPDLQHEIIEAWWRMSVFQFKTSQLIPKFISEDFWCATVKDQMKNVLVDLSYREPNSRFHLGQQAKLGPTVAGTDLDTELAYIHALSRVSKVALAIKKRDFRKSLATVQERQRRFLHAASKLYPGLEKLQKDGYHVSVIVDGDIEIKVEGFDISTDGWRKQIYDAEELAPHFNQHRGSNVAFGCGTKVQVLPRSKYTFDGKVPQDKMSIWHDALQLFLRMRIYNPISSGPHSTVLRLGICLQLDGTGGWAAWLARPPHSGNVVLRSAFLGPAHETGRLTDQAKMSPRIKAGGAPFQRRSLERWENSAASLRPEQITGGATRAPKTASDKPPYGKDLAPS
ncbi:uncharacterized protein CC84DRAFT_1209796, partial [Paraphaeosphaeria sporulosa]